MPELNELRVSRRELASSLKKLSSFAKDFRQPARLSLESCQLTIDAGAAKVIVDARGSWVGVFSIAPDQFRKLIAIDAWSEDEIQIRVEGDSIRFGTFILSGTWQPSHIPRIELPLDPPLLDLLAIPQFYSTEVIDQSQLTPAIRAAEVRAAKIAAEAQELFDKATRILSCVCDVSAPNAMFIIEEAVRERVNVMVSRQN